MMHRNHDWHMNLLLKNFNFSKSHLVRHHLAKRDFVIKIAYLLSTLVREFWLLRRSITLAV